MKKILFTFPENEDLGKKLAQKTGIPLGNFVLRNFPDGETYLRLEEDVKNVEVILLASLDAPNRKFLPLSFLSSTARDMGAKKVGLIAPYLSYMRQDIRFQAGEALSSSCFAQHLSRLADWLITIDPHLHRYKSLSEIYSIPTITLHANHCIANWIAKQSMEAILIGPDSESAQWVGQIAAKANAPFVILQKTRRGDRDVEIGLPDMSPWKGKTPIIIDDVISTGNTIRETIRQIKAARMNDPLCIAVHGLFADNAYQDLLESGASEVISCNTIAHESNKIDISDLLADTLLNMQI